MYILEVRQYNRIHMNYFTKYIQSDFDFLYLFNNHLSVRHNQCIVYQYTYQNIFYVLCFLVSRQTPGTVHSQSQGIRTGESGKNSVFHQRSRYLVLRTSYSDRFTIDPGGQLWLGLATPYPLFIYSQYKQMYISPNINYIIPCKTEKYKNGFSYSTYYTYRQVGIYMVCHSSILHFPAALKCLIHIDCKKN